MLWYGLSIFLYDIEITFFYSLISRRLKVLKNDRNLCSAPHNLFPSQNISKNYSLKAAPSSEWNHEEKLSKLIQNLPGTETILVLDSLTGIFTWKEQILLLQWLKSQIRCQLLTSKKNRSTAEGTARSKHISISIIPRYNPCIRSV